METTKVSQKKIKSRFDFLPAKIATLDSACISILWTNFGASDNENVYNTNTSLSLDQISSENESPNYPANQYTDAYLASFEGINTSIESPEHNSEDDLHEK
jgi:hypothetical protein